eukprot:Lithocolla_globosa_v1_NODE_7116_length_990_cov_7.535829.p1 type:complete len:252 gc:universal NODE_7116_length_990_cov_7.535829:896-141(-)
MFGLVGGSSLRTSTLFVEHYKCEEFLQDTKYGQVKLGVVTTDSNKKFYFCQRHHCVPDVKYSPPHLIPRQAIVEAFKLNGIETVVGICSVGSMDPTTPPGTLVVPDDYVNFWSICSMSDTESAHIVPEYDEPLRQKCMKILNQAKIKHLEKGTYVQTRGPRFETKAEIKILKNYGEIVGMTGADEATLFKEAGISYAALCIVDNFANGITSSLKWDDFKDGQKNNLHLVEESVHVFVDNLGHDTKRKTQED